MGSEGKSRSFRSFHPSLTLRRVFLSFLYNAYEIRTIIVARQENMIIAEGQLDEEYGR